MSLWYLPLVVSATLFFAIIGGYYTLCINNVVQSIDRYSAANFQYLESIHYNLDLTIDFTKSIMSGSITHTFKSITTGISHIVLDVDHLAIKKVYETRTKKELSWSVYPFEYISNAANEQMVIKLDRYLAYGDMIDVTIEYSTSPTATAVSWVPENQTFGGKYKYMYTQCESIYGRSVAPLQDSPAIKSTFNATLRVAAPYVAIASALLVSKSEENGMMIYNYAQRIPVPSYLLALVAGNIAYGAIGRRTGVYAEPEIMEKVVNEMQEMETFMDIIENLLTPYIWGVYSVVIMPPSFPFGGMENPYLTFVSPSIIIGDRSSTYVVAHEIGHSWFGNQITCKNWTHFWLNEGFTRYAERIILKKLYGMNKYTCQCKIGVADVEVLINKYMANGKSECTKLFPNVYHDGPDDITTTVAYEKGFLFLVFLERLLGEDNFYDFLRAYLTTLSYKPIDAWDMKEIFISYVKNYMKEEADKILKQIDWNKWFFGTGMPTDVIEYNNDQIKSSIDLSNYYIVHKQGPANNTIYKSFMLDLRIIFMRNLISREKELATETLRAIDKDYNVTLDEKNPEVQVLWLQLMIRRQCTEVDGVAKKFLESIGRQKYVVPIFGAYAVHRKDYAKSLYNELKYRYHPIAQRSIERAMA